jgi:hypothetical protein
MQGYFEIEFQFEDLAFAVLQGPNITYWSPQGRQEFVGLIDDFASKYPARLQVLLKHNFVKTK